MFVFPCDPPLLLLELILISVYEEIGSFAGSCLTCTPKAETLNPGKGCGVGMSILKGHD